MHGSGIYSAIAICFIITPSIHFLHFMLLPLFYLNYLNWLREWDLNPRSTTHRILSPAPLTILGNLALLFDCRGKVLVAPQATIPMVDFMKDMTSLLLLGKPRFEFILG